MIFLPKNLNYLAKREGLTQDALSKKLELEQSTVQRIMSGKTMYPRLDSLLAISKCFGHGLDELVHHDLEAGVAASQPTGHDDATMAQAVELLHLMADVRPEDDALHRISWNAIQVAAKAITRAEGSQRKAVLMILEDLKGE